jgi:hypothetical protein
LPGLDLRSVEADVPAHLPALNERISELVDTP